MDNTKEIFTIIYKENIWQCSESRSGGGATVAITNPIRNSLQQVIDHYQIDSMIDAPCGDYNWMKEIRPNLPIFYIGGDIVSELISQNQQKFGDAETKFIEFNIISDPIPEVDLFFCRECLQHLNNSQINGFLSNFLSSEIPYLLTTNHFFNAELVNNDCETGGTQFIDLCQAPFNLPQPLQRFFDYQLSNDYGIFSGMTIEMALWHKRQFV